MNLVGSPKKKEIIADYAILNEMRRLQTSSFDWSGVFIVSMGETKYFPRKQKKRKKKYICTRKNKVLAKYVPNGDRYYKKMDFQLIIIFLLETISLNKSHV